MKKGVGKVVKKKEEENKHRRTYYYYFIECRKLLCVIYIYIHIVINALFS